MGCDDTTCLPFRDAAVAVQRASLAPDQPATRPTAAGPPRPPAALEAGDRVEVRSAREILDTLDEMGALDGLPFMPEMIEFIGRQLRVSRRVEKTCVDGSHDGIREMRNNDVVFLEDLRCSGQGHGGCGRACMLFWKEKWLRRLDETNGSHHTRAADPKALERLAARVRTKSASGDFYCQSSELERATRPLSRWRRLWKCVRDVRASTYSPAEMFWLVARPIAAKVIEIFVPRYPVNNGSRTPAQNLDLQAGDWVQIKSLAEIRPTLDAHGRNRGLQFSYDLAKFCGRRFRVRNRLEHMIIERSGKMLNVSHTVILDGITCPCRCVIGGCPRADLIYWREIWLRKIPEPEENGPRS